MRHPDPSEWMAFLYGEVSREERQDIDAHLAVCPDCVRRLGRWRETLGMLDAAGVPERRRPGRRWWVSGRWAAAAAVLLAAGVVLGRQGGISPAQFDARIGSLRAQFQQDLAAGREAYLQQVADASVRLARAENEALMGEFLRRFQRVRADDRDAMLALLRQIDERRGVETAKLREGLVNLAASTGTGFEQTQTQVQLLAKLLPERSSISEESNRNQPTENQP